MLFKKKKLKIFFQVQWSVLSPHLISSLTPSLVYSWKTRGVGAGHAQGMGNRVKDASRSPLSKGLGLIPNVSFGVISLKSIFSTCVQAP